MEIKKRILLVDDDDSIRMFFEIALSDEGHDVLACVDGTMAIEEIRGSKRFDIGIIDLRMPEVTGDEVARFFRRESPETIVVLMTASSDEDIKKRLLSEGVIDCFLPKPCDLDWIINLSRSSLEEIRTGSFTYEAKHI